MLLNVAAAMDLPDLLEKDDGWIERCRRPAPSARAAPSSERVAPQQAPPVPRRRQRRRARRGPRAQVSRGSSPADVGLPPAPAQAGATG